MFAICSVTLIKYLKIMSTPPGSSIKKKIDFEDQNGTTYQLKGPFFSDDLELYEYHRIIAGRKKLKVQRSSL